MCNSGYVSKASDISLSTFSTFHFKSSMYNNLLTCLKVELNLIVLYCLRYLVASVQVVLFVFRGCLLHEGVVPATEDFVKVVVVRVTGGQ